jgi:integrase
LPKCQHTATLLRSVERRAVLIVPNTTGLRWQYRNFSGSWNAVCERSGIDGVQRRDLRRAAMVRMAEAGATTAKIAAVSGHTIDQMARILDTYIPRRGEVAAGAIEA